MAVPYRTVAGFAAAFVVVFALAVALNSPRLFWIGFAALAVSGIATERFYYKRRPATHSLTEALQQIEYGD